MIRTISNVIAGEGFSSAMRRARERIAEARDHYASRIASVVAPNRPVPLLNVAAGGLSPRNGGVAVQLGARLRAERDLRPIAVFHPDGLILSHPFTHARRATSIDDALALVRATAIHYEGTDGVSIDHALGLMHKGIRVVVSLHDFSLFSSRDDMVHEFLSSATGVVFASTFLRDAYRERLSLPLTDAVVIEPASPATIETASDTRRGIAYAGSVKPHKGGQLLPEIARALAARKEMLHVFGGGDRDLLVALRKYPNVVIHGYYRSGALPSLLARYGIGVVFLPSVVPEAFSLTLSEVWCAGATAIAFDLGAQGERIRRHGGGLLAPLDSGAEGLVARLDDMPKLRVAFDLPTPVAAARAHVEAYRRWGLL